MFGSLLGTYLELYFTGKGWYAFPIRPLPEIFTINILFTLAGLPILTAAFLWLCKKLNPFQTILLILISSTTMAAAEPIAETLGLLTHHPNWHHTNTLIGYTLYLTLIRLLWK
ncbi:hypothetical protein D1B31_03965 [Neobacillus notoginsengisoli]|uniref:Uncharacterized protein n=2 Tax=Neobacillus notoginsengisoli TaxID=1578198 RepID=A0A417YYP6_9BACI|nr:hypothetical protein D1B31_03965 [Neobacillus notoginsengisoli]